MIRPAIIAFLLAVPARAQESPSKIERLGYGQDWIEIVSEASDRATVSYHNHVQELSNNGTFTLQVGQIVVDLTIEVGGAEVGNREILTVRPRGDFIAIPEKVMALDGETVSVLVVLPMF